MIIGDIRITQEEEKSLAPVLRQVIDYLRTTDFTNMEVGKYEIQGDDIFLMIQNPTTDIKLRRRMEGHAKYIDVQYLIEGEQEIIYVSRKTADLVASEDFIAEKDVAFYDKVGHEILGFKRILAILSTVGTRYLSLANQQGGSCKPA